MTQPVVLNDLVVIHVSGQDATEFLQSQLTQDLDIPGQDKAALAAYCTPKGRVLASMVIIPASAAENGWLLVTRADNADTLISRLRMFVLRAKVEISLTDLHVTGHKQAMADTPATPAWQAHHGDAVYSITLPSSDATASKRWWTLSADKPQTAMDSNEARQAWWADDIAAGLPWVQQDNREVYLAQTLNLDLLEAVSFTKGCYPGQEVVARSHYRGVIKRRAAYGTAPIQDIEQGHVLIGKDIFDAQRPKNPCGRIINAAITNNTLHVLMETQLADLENKADFRLGSPEGAAITVQLLPYPLVAQSE